MTDQEPVHTEASGDASAPFPIVAIGASAGGLAPTLELIRLLGPTPGFAIVVIHHLDPTHDSGLCEVLAKATSMPVTKAADGPAEQNHVYVIQPNTGLLMAQGQLKVVERVEERGLHLPIDRFFKSLAQDHGSLAVGVVLSGTGFDGTAGIKAIKAAAGLTVAQDASAQHASMPEHAIATGCVDVVAAPERIARELLRFGTHPGLFRRAGTAEDGEYQQILNLVRRQSGIDFSGYKRSTIERRMQRRVFLHHLTTLAEYRELLLTTPAEVTALAEEMLIHVTEFFRDPEAFEALATTAFPKLFEARNADSPLRIWVPGCSTGEEVYSLAIRLLEFTDARPEVARSIKIFGTDLSTGTVDQARSGRYTDSIEREVSPARLQRFFVRSDGGYQIRPEVRDLCVFARHDVTRDPPFSSLDLVSCRNLMIYLGPELQARVIALFHYALREPGFLWLGTSETVRNFPGFAAADEKHRVYARTSAASRVTFDFATPSGRLEPPLGLGAHSPHASGARTTLPTDVFREADRLALAAFAPPGVVVTDDLTIVQFRGETGSFLEPTPGAASLDLLRMAREQLRLPLQRLIERARVERKPQREGGLPPPSEGDPYTVAIEVNPFTVHSTQQRYLLVLFEREPAARAPAPAMVAEAGEATAVARIREELASTRRYLESVIEQHEVTNEELKAANEEVVSSNEELRSANEELQSAKEELQATNEALRTVNAELNQRNSDATRLNDDLTNVLSSMEIPLVILGRDSRLRRFTPAAAKLFALRHADLGRAIGELARLSALDPDLPRLIAQVLDELRPIERSIEGPNQRFYQLLVRPYITLDGRIDGTVLAALDVDAARRGAAALEAALQLSDGIVDTVRDGLLVLEPDLRIRSANQVFLRMFSLTQADVVGRPLDSLAPMVLSGATLQNLLAMLDGSAIEHIRIESGGDDRRRRIFSASARRIAQSSLVLLALADITEAERADEAKRQAEQGLRDILIHAGEAILMVDQAGMMLLVNDRAAQLFGYAADELVGQPVEKLVPERFGETHVRERTVYTATPVARPMGAQRTVVGRRKTGEEFPLEVTLSPSPRPGAGPRVVAFIRDLTQQRQMDRRIAEYQEAILHMAFDITRTNDAERRKIAVELHDRIGQTLALAQLKLSTARASSAPQAQDAIDEAVKLLTQTVADTRSLTFELSPPILYDLGLKEALDWLAEDLHKRHGIAIEIVDEALDTPLDDETKAVLFRSIRELLMNVLKHAKTPTAKVSLSNKDGAFLVTVEDEGVGFDLVEGAAPPKGSFGLLSVREQLRQLGGIVEVVSRPKEGTRVSLHLPLPSTGAAVASS